MLSKMIRDARLAAGLSQAGLGQKLGLSDAAVNHWESGKSEPSRKHMAALIELLGLDPAIVNASPTASPPATTAAPARARLRTPLPDILDMPRKTPILGSIPGLGWAFKKKDKSSTEVELMVFLCPKVVRSSEDAQKLLRDVKVKAPLLKNWEQDSQTTSRP